MIRLILLTDFTEAFAHNLLRGILEYSKEREPWVVCRMPPSYKQSHGIPGVLKWAKNGRQMLLSLSLMMMMKSNCSGKME